MPISKEVDHDIATTRREYDRDSLWSAVMDKSRQPQGETIHEFLKGEKQQTVRTYDLWILVCEKITAIII